MEDKAGHIPQYTILLVEYLDQQPRGADGTTPSGRGRHFRVYLRPRLYKESDSQQDRDRETSVSFASIRACKQWSESRSN